MASHFDKQFRLLFTACPVLHPENLKIKPNTAVIVTTPYVIRKLDLPTLTRRIQTVIVSKTVDGSIFDHLLQLPPPYVPNKKLMTKESIAALADVSVENLLSGGEASSTQNRQIIALLQHSFQFNTAQREFAEHEVPVKVLTEPYDPSDFRAAVNRVSHGSVCVEAEEEALATMLKCLVRLGQKQQQQQQQRKQAEEQPRVAIVLSREMSRKDAEHLDAILNRPALLKRAYNNDTPWPWFRQRFVNLATSRQPELCLKKFRHHNVNLIVLPESIATEIRLGPLNFVLFFGMPSPPCYLSVCRRLLVAGSCRGNVVYHIIFMVVLYFSGNCSRR